MNRQAGPITRRELLVRGGLAVGGVAALAVGLPLVVGSSRASAEDFDAEVPTAWFDLMLGLVRSTAGFTPPVASRAFAYAGVALYEAVVAGSDDYRSLQDVLPGLRGLPDAGGGSSWPLVANAALAASLQELFATTSDANKQAIDTLESSFTDRLGAGALRAGADAAARRGQEVARAVLQWAMTDGGHEGHLRNYPPGYVLPTGPGLWVPTPPGFSPPMLPDWGQNRCFAIGSPAACPAGGPTPYSEQPDSPFYAEAIEVYEAVNAATPEQSAIAWFWADDPAATATPAGHSVSIATHVLRTQNASLMTAAETYAKVGIALADAFIACWHAKYQHNLIRPVSYLNAHLDAHWLPTLTTPPFPEHPSGHSVQTAAAMQVLTDLFGDDHAFDDHTHDERGMTARHFDSFTHAADEAAISRLYGGIHYQPAIQLGLAQGRCIGQAASGLPVHA